MAKQKTIKEEIIHHGIGLHSGKKVNMIMKPASEDTGIVFVRHDLPNSPQTKANAFNVSSTLRATTIGTGDEEFYTIEHLLSALYIMDIDNIYISLDSKEPPVNDGSALEFINLIEKVGVIEQSKDKRIITIDKVLRIDDKDRFVMVVPYDGFRVSFTSLNDHPLIGVQYYDFIFNSIDDYKENIAPARTIAYEKEVATLKKMGLGLGGNLDNVIVYNDEGWMNPLRFSNELVRHKILDVIGDINLAGKIKGHIIAVKSGHELNTKLAKLIMEEYK